MQKLPTLRIPLPFRNHQEPPRAPLRPLRETLLDLRLPHVRQVRHHVARAVREHLDPVAVLPRVAGREHVQRRLARAVGLVVLAVRRVRRVAA